MILPLIKGLAVTFKYLFSRPFAMQYPDEKIEMTDRWRGIHYFERKEDGSTQCVACGLCEAVCPSNCIYVEAEEYKNGQRFPRVYEIDGTRCIFCGFCEEVCPVNAIKMGKNYEYVKHERLDFVFNTHFLIDQKKRNP